MKTGTSYWYEWLLVWRDRAPLVAVVIFLGAALYAGYAGGRYYRATTTAAEAAETRFREALEEQRQEALQIEAEFRSAGASLDSLVWGARHPYAYGSGLGYTVVLPPKPLAALAVGQGDLLPSIYTVRVTGNTGEGETDRMDSPLRLHTGLFDLGFVVVFLVPLLIIGLTFNLTATEREQGMLRMIAAQATPLHRIVRSRLMVRATVLVAVFVAGAGLALMAAGIGSALATPGFWGWVLVTLAYAGFWFGLALLVNALGRTAAVNAMVLVASWLVLVVVVPTVISLVVGALHPVPTRMEYIAAMRTESQVAEQQSSESLARYFEDHPELAPVTDDDANFAMLRVARNERITESLAPLVERFNQALEAQHAWSRALAVLSPATLVQQSLQHVAGTGYDRHRAFRTQVDDFHEAWERHFAPRYFAGTSFYASEVDHLPQFRFDEPGDGGRSFWIPVAVLLGGALAMGGIGLRAYRRYAVIG